MTEKVYIPEDKKLLDPKVDSTFKTLFTHEGPGSKIALKGLVKAGQGSNRHRARDCRCSQQRAAEGDCLCQGYTPGPAVQDGRRQQNQHRDADIHHEK